MTIFFVLGFEPFKGFHLVFIHQVSQGPVAQTEKIGHLPHIAARHLARFLEIFAGDLVEILL